MVSGRRARSDPTPRRPDEMSEMGYTVDTNRAAEVACGTCDKHDEETLPDPSAACMDPQPQPQGFGDDRAISGDSSSVCVDDPWSNNGGGGSWHVRSDISQGVDLQLMDEGTKKKNNGAAGWWRACSDICSLSSFSIYLVPFAPFRMQKGERKQQVRENGIARPPNINDSEDDLDLEGAFTKRKVDVDGSDGAGGLPKVSELVEPDLEPDLHPYAQAGIVRQVTEEHWCSWNQRQSERDTEQSGVNTRNLSSVSKRKSWVDLTHDEVERKPEEKVAKALSPALDMPMATSVAPSTAYTSVQAIAASALLGCSFGQEQQTDTQRLHDAELKSGRGNRRRIAKSRRAGASSIDRAAWQLQKEERKQQVRENGRARPPNINNDSEDDLDLEDAFTKRQVDVDCSDGAGDLPKVSELDELDWSQTYSLMRKLISAGD